MFKHYQCFWCWYFVFHPFYLQRAQTGIWPTPSITLGTGKPKGDPQSLPSTYKPGEIKPEEKIKQVGLLCRFSFWMKTKRCSAWSIVGTWHFNPVMPSGLCHPYYIVIEQVHFWDVLFGVLFHFYFTCISNRKSCEQILVQTLVRRCRIWVCTVCLGPKKGCFISDEPKWKTVWHYFGYTVHF